MSKRAAFLSSIIVTAALAAPIPAAAQEGHPGLGMETALNLPLTTGMILFVYDLRQWRVDGLFGLGLADDVVSFGTGVRFHYVLHSSDHADFSIGGGGFVFHGGNSNGRVGGVTRGELEVLAQIRAFIVDHVAVQGALGLGVGFGTGPVSLVLTGQLNATFGFVYFF